MSGRRTNPSRARNSPTDAVIEAAAQQGSDTEFPCARGQFIECKTRSCPVSHTLSASDRTVATTTIAIRAALDRQTTRATTNRQGHNK